MFAKGWKAMKELKADLVDTNFYRPGHAFLSHGLRYGGDGRQGPRVLVGDSA